MAQFWHLTGPTTLSPTWPRSKSSAEPSSAASSTNTSGPRRCPGQGWWPSFGTPHPARRRAAETATRTRRSCAVPRPKTGSHRWPDQRISPGRMTWTRFPARTTPGSSTVRCEFSVLRVGSAQRPRWHCNQPQRPVLPHDSCGADLAGLSGREGIATSGLCSRRFGAIHQYIDLRCRRWRTPRAWCR